MSNKKLPICINIFPTLDCVELVQFDDSTGEIEKAASLPCSFDQISRQMSSSEQMGQAIRDLMNMNRVPVNTPAVLVLPSFFTREIELPSEFSREELRFALVSEAERFYIFKKVEPQIDWINLDESRLLYSAFPKTEIDKYVQIFRELRVPLVAIELSYFSILRGLVSTGAVAQEVDNNERWCLLVVSDNSFFASIQQGMQIVKSTDAPLSVTAEDEHASVQEIQQDFEAFIDMEHFNRLVIVQNAARINTESLMNQLGYQGNMILIEQNPLTLRSRGSTEGQFPCSLEAIGGVFYTQLAELPKMNFVLESGEDVVGIMEYRQLAFKWLLGLNVAVFLICLLLWGILALLGLQKDMEREQLAAKVGQLGTMATGTEFNEINRKKYIKRIVDQNVSVNNFLVKLGSSMTTGVWLDKIDLSQDKTDSPLLITIEGRAMNLEEVNNLRTSLNKQMPNENLEVSNAAQATSEDGQSYFTWVMQNKAAVEATARPGG